MSLSIPVYDHLPSQQPIQEALNADGDSQLDLSVVIPIYNEVENLSDLLSFNRTLGRGRATINLQRAIA